MENWHEFLQILIKVVFIVLVPALIIYFRVKKKISTGFAFGAIIMSLVVSLMGVASIYEDPADLFIKEINAGNYEESKRQYKIIIQGGPEKIAEVDENKIIYRENFSRIKNELIAEYEEIAERIYKTESVEKVEDCADRVTQEKSLSSLKHALNLLNYSRSIGGTNTLLYEKITTAIEKGEKTVEENKGKCQ
jgi:hypothetical protein